MVSVFSSHFYGHIRSRTCTFVFVNRLSRSVLPMSTCLNLSCDEEEFLSSWQDSLASLDFLYSHFRELLYRRLFREQLRLFINAVHIIYKFAKQNSMFFNDIKHTRNFYTCLSHHNHIYNSYHSKIVSCLWHFSNWIIKIIKYSNLNMHHHKILLHSKQIMIFNSNSQAWIECYMDYLRLVKHYI